MVPNRTLEWVKEVGSPQTRNRVFFLAIHSTGDIEAMRALVPKPKISAIDLNDRVVKRQSDSAKPKFRAIPGQ